MKKIAIFGSTGSIGSSLLKIIKDDQKNFKIELLTTNKNYKKLIKQVKFFNVKNIVVTDYNSFLVATKLLKNTKVKVFKDFDSLNKIFKVNNKIDGGPIYLKKKLTLNGSAQEIFIRAAKIVLEMIKKINIARLNPKPQKPSKISFKRLTKKDNLIDLKKIKN